MQSSILINSGTRQNHKILIIGQAEDAVITEGLPEQIQIQYCENVLDALAKITTETFELIAIVLGKVDGNLKSALRTIRRIRPESRLILLAKMYQEPHAAELVNSFVDGEKGPDDYAISPVSFTLGQNQESSSENGKEIIRQKQKIEILEKLVMEDELTCVKNRRFAAEFLRQIIERTKKESIHITVLTFDIDNFKEYNDRYGHPVGDSILKQVAVLMQKCCRKQDVIARIGGDEFAVVFWSTQKNEQTKTENPHLQDERRNPQSQHPSEAEIISERFRTELNKTDLPALGAYGKGTLTISGGLARFPDDGATAQQLLSQADSALMDAKRSGKNRVYLVGREL
ncbi:MAG: GGDEF domain-containing protein [Anaerohalosphaeraceae bacterium]|nr:GGDEF domain-containing protein [Anaerohalosphaeraceae bacterium]